MCWACHCHRPNTTPMNVFMWMWHITDYTRQIKFTFWLKVTFLLLKFELNIIFVHVPDPQCLAHYSWQPVIQIPNFHLGFNSSSDQSDAYVNVSGLWIHVSLIFVYHTYTHPHHNGYCWCHADSGLAAMHEMKYLYLGCVSRPRVTETWAVWICPGSTSPDVITTSGWL